MISFYSDFLEQKDETLRRPPPVGPLLSTPEYAVPGLDLVLTRFGAVENSILAACGKLTTDSAMPIVANRNEHEAD